MRGETRTTSLMFQVPNEAMHSFNYIKANAARFLPRSLVASVTASVLKPKASGPGKDGRPAGN